MIIDFVMQMDKVRRSVKPADLKAKLDDIYQKIESNLLWMERDHKKIMKAIIKMWRKNGILVKWTYYILILYVGNIPVIIIFVYKTKPFLTYYIVIL